MKHLKVLLILIVLGMASPTLSVAGNNSGGKVPSETIILRPRKPAGRPNAPSRSQIECSYHNGILEFSFPENVDVMVVELCNEEHSVTETVYRDSPILELPPLCGVFDIRCMTDDGRIYYGMIQLSV